MRSMFRVIAILMFVCIVPVCSMASFVFQEEGRYISPKEICVVQLKISPKGGFSQLFIEDHVGGLVHVADNVTGFLWLDGGSLIFSSSPIYGKPGIFELICSYDDLTLITLMASENIYSAYPDGADYFELKEVVDGKLWFYYGADVEVIDFNDFRIEANIR
ncbi:hypothetical protein LGV61_05010 [Desulfurispirillum indicum]|uniref:hypothetical protein n=1 Tax=Desulfurispirillum indicum TaxID=936456 RepID=UPI001CFAEDD9|nr:hypothetical protein [Desulfurispirillum indicum]UCZ57639.1 hypothetical protein LGV61_05010 [Desulfurispirillum indicum]